MLGDPRVAASLTAYALLELLSLRGRAAVVDVAERAGVRLQAACQALKRVEEAAPGLVEVDPGCGEVRARDFFELVLALVSKGLVSPEKAARLLDWRDFEEFAARVLQSYGYRVYRNVYRPPPRGFQVDVVAVQPSGRYALVVDCKHWEPRHSSPSRLKRAVARHVDRAKLLLAYWTSARGLGEKRRPRAVLPVLVVLRENVPPLVEGVPVVPASKLRGFMEELEAILEDPRVRLIKAEA